MRDAAGGQPVICENAEREPRTSTTVAWRGREALRCQAWQVGPAAWVSLVLPAAPGPTLPAGPASLGGPTASGGRARRLADRRAGRAAEVVALRAARLAPGAARVSRSHSSGAGAAAVAPAGWRAGVDVMPVGRVTTRHARAVASAAEIAAAEGAAGAVSAPALVWALKEAAVKAAGLRGLGAMPEWAVGGAGPGWAELSCSATGARAAAGWVAAGGFVCAWVVAPAADRSSGG